MSSSSSQNSETDKYNDILEAIGLAVNGNHPLILWGEPGTGKTSYLEALAGKMDRPIDTLIAAICDPTDFLGLPYPESGESRYLPPEWAVRKAEEGNGIMFFDELSLAPPAVQNAMLRVVLDKRVGRLDMGAGTAMVAAGNPVESTSNAWELSSALANRLLHFQWNPPTQVVSDGFMYDEWPVVAPPNVDEEAVVKEARKIKQVIAAFFKANSKLVNNRPEDVSSAGLAWPSQRMWNTVADLLARATVNDSSNGVRRELVIATVGNAAAAEFLSYLDNIDLPDPEKVLKDPTIWTITPNRSDQAYAVLGSAFAYMKANLSKKTWTQYGQLLDYTAAKDPDSKDVVIAQSRGWIEITTQGKRNWWNLEIANTMNELTPVLYKANIIPKP